MPIVLDTLNLADAERKLCEEALVAAGSIVEAANLLGITRHALKRRIVKHTIEWPKPRVSSLRPVESPIIQRSAVSAF
jgi:DNA-binding NtrC family response regulator